MSEAQIYNDPGEHLREEFDRLVIFVNRALDRARNETEAGNSDASSVPGAPGDDVPDPAIAAKRARREIDARLKASAEAGVHPRAVWLRFACSLSEPEFDIFLLCLAPQLDERFRHAYAYLNGDRPRTSATPALLARLLSPVCEGDALRFHLGRDAPLMNLRLLRGRPESPDENIVVDVGAADFVLGRPGPPAMQGCPLERLLESGPVRSAAETRRILESIAARLPLEAPLKSPFEPGHVIYLQGPRDGDMLRGAAEIAASGGYSILTIRPDGFAGMDPAGAHEAGLLFARQCLLEAARPVLDLRDEDRVSPPAQAFCLAVLGVSRVVMIIAGRPPEPARWSGAPMRLQSVEFPEADFELRESMWNDSPIASPAFEGDLTPRDLAGMYRLEPRALDRALARARELLEIAEGDGFTDDIIIQACRGECASALDKKASRVRTVFAWDDLVLPEDRIAQLRQVRAHFRNQSRLFRDWGFSAKSASGKGIHVLFSGPPGTGKTMAAAIIAGELRLEIFKVDLSAVVSKYIGETEKNLAEIFREARKSNAVLFFDEADALFGKRSEVKDAHDRFANVEVSFLLQCMDDYEGITVLATNYQQNMDQAFTRRIHHVVVFPFPDIAARDALWRNQFPDRVPLAADMDFQFLARALKFSGGEIRNAAFQAALIAAEEDGEVNMERIMRAARREIEKAGKAFVPADFAPYHEHVSAPGPN